MPEWLAVPDWVTPTSTPTTSLGPLEMLLRLVASALYGGCVAGIYHASHGRHKQGESTLNTTLVLLSILIAMVSLVIGDIVARAFSLVGVLSIVRFRTVVEDTRDTAFVIFAVVVGMAAGAGLFMVPLIGIPVVGVVSILLSAWGQPKYAASQSAESPLSVRLGLGRDPEAVFGEILKRHLESHRLTVTSTARQGAALDLNYLVRLRSTTNLVALVTELNQVEGVQNVELRV